MGVAREGLPGTPRERLPVTPSTSTASQQRPLRRRSHKLLPIMKLNILSHPQGSNSPTSLDSPVTSITFQQAHKATPSNGLDKNSFSEPRLTLWCKTCGVYHFGHKENFKCPSI